LLEIQDPQNIQYDDGKITLNFDGFKDREDDSIKELSILQSMVDTDVISEAEADKFRTINNSEAQNKYYTALFDDLEANINTLRAKGLDSRTAITATIKEMADETKANQEEADRIDSCGDNQICVDNEIKQLSDELIIDDEEASEIIKINEQPNQQIIQSLSSDIDNTSYRDVLINDNYAYVILRSGQLLTYDLSLKESDKKPIETLVLTDTDWAGTGSIIKIDNNTIYIQGNKLYIVDISTVSKPVLVSTKDYSVTWLKGTIYNNFLLLGEGYNKNKVYLFNISNSKDPILLTTYSDLGNAIFGQDGYIYSYKKDSTIKKYSFNQDNYNIILNKETDDILSREAYHMYFYNKKLILGLEDDGSKIKIYDTVDMSLKKEYDSSNSRAGGQKDNIVIIGYYVYDLNNIDKEPESLSKHAYCVDGFPFGIYINDNGTVYISSQDSVLVDRITK